MTRVHSYVRRRKRESLVTRGTVVQVRPGPRRGAYSKQIVILQDKGRKKKVISKTVSKGMNESVADTIDDLLTWELVPPTIVRVETHPRLEGSEVSMQEWVEGRRLASYSEASKKVIMTQNDDRMMKMAVLDYMIGNEDRHNNNIVVGRRGKIWAIDNGDAFPSSSQFYPHNRVSFDYARGREIPANIMQDLENLEEGDLRAALAPLERGQINGVVARWKRLVAERKITWELLLRRGT